MIISSKAIKALSGEEKLNKIILLLIYIIFLSIFTYLVSKNIIFAFVFVVLVALALILYEKPKIGIFLCIFSILGGQLIKLNINQGGAGLLISDILIPFFLLIWLVRVLVKKEKITSTFIGPFLFLFLLIALLSLVNGLRFIEMNQAMVSFFYLIRLVNYALLFFASATIFSQDEKGIYHLKAIFLFVFILFSLGGIFQIIFFPSLVSWAIKYGWDPHMGRLFSTFLDPNFAGAFLVIASIVSLALFLYSKSTEGRVIFGLSSLLSVISVILTYSRSSYLFLAISFLALAILKSKKLLFLGIAVVIILLIIFPKSLERIEGGFSVDESAKQRFMSWEKTINIIEDNAVLGVGYNAYRFAQERYGFIDPEIKGHADAGSDSSILTIFATTGLLGLISYVIFYLASLIKAKKVFNSSPSSQKQALALALIAIMVGLIFHSIFVNSLLYPAIMIPLFLLLGVISSKNKVQVNNE